MNKAVFRLKMVVIVLIISILFANSAFATQPLLDPASAGINGQSRENNYEELVNGLLANNNVVSVVDNKLWVPWFSSSSRCELVDLKSGASCNSGQSIDFEHNCMVTDEFSQVGILIAMGKNQQWMDQFYNSLNAIKSSFGSIPAWRVYRDGNTIEPCKKSVNSNCDTASDATARIIISLYIAANNPNFKDQNQKVAYLQHANQLASDMLTYEIDQKCRASSLGYGDICYWLAAGSQAKKGGLASTDYGYTGYYADAIIAMLMACSQTRNNTYCEVASHLTLNYLQAAKFDGVRFTVPPGRSFKWDTSSGVPTAVCTNTCNPDRWDFADAPRALGMCQANYYAKLMNYQLPGLEQYCKLWGDKYATNTNSMIIQYNPNGSAAGSAIGGYYYQGLQSLLQSGYNPNLFQTTLDNALKHYKNGVWDNEACYGVYTKAFAVRALGFGIGKDLGVFTTVGLPVCVPLVEVCDGKDNNCNNQIDENNICEPKAPICVPSTEVCDGKDNNCDGVVDEGYICKQNTTNSRLATLSSSCIINKQACTLISDVTSGACRTIQFSSQFGDIKIQACEKVNNFIEVYRQVSPSQQIFSSCIDKGCVNQSYGFTTFQLSSSSVPTCVPSEEICDGKDNNCDGLVDESDMCQPKQPICVPSEEICDGKDNNCDGLVDENNICEPKAPICVPSTEVCDGKDNNCDGLVDENNICDSILPEPRPDPQQESAPSAPERPTISSSQAGEEGGGGSENLLILASLEPEQDKKSPEQNNGRKASFDLERELPVEAHHNEVVPVKLTVKNAIKEGKVIISEILPEGAVIKDWFIVGTDESKEDVKFFQNGRALIWEFTADESYPYVEYLVKLPESGSLASFSTIYSVSSKILGNLNSRIKLASPVPFVSSLANTVKEKSNFKVVNLHLFEIVGIGMIILLAIGLLVRISR